MDAFITVPDPRLGNLMDALANRSVIPHRSVVISRPANLYCPACPSHPHTISLFQVLRQAPLTGGLQSFFVITSWSICLSRLRSATSFFSCLFSSSSCFRRLSSLPDRRTSSSSCRMWALLLLFYGIPRIPLCRSPPALRQTLFVVQWT